MGHQSCQKECQPRKVLGVRGFIHYTENEKCVLCILVPIGYLLPSGGIFIVWDISLRRSVDQIGDAFVGPIGLNTVYCPVR